MRRFFRMIAALVLMLTVFAGCAKKNPLSGKKFAMKVSDVETVTYVFSDDKMWLDGFDLVKMDYRFDAQSNSVIMTEFDGLECTIPMSKLKQVGK